MVFVQTALESLRFPRAIGVVGLLAVLAGCSDEPAAVATETVRPVKVVEVSEPDTGRRMEYSGSVRARTEMALGFRVNGKITERLVDVGQHVKPGDVLARLDATDYGLSVRSAEANLSAARKQEEIADLARRRAETLASKNIASRSELEQAQLSHDQAVSSRESAEASLKQARNQVAYTELKADMSGIVTSIGADIGHVVASGTPVVNVAVDGAKEVQIAVPETDISNFTVGKTVDVQFWSHEDLQLTGKIREVSGSADPQSRTFAVRVSLPEDTQVLLGMTATVEAVEQKSGSTYDLPLASLGKRDGGTIVWVVDRDTSTVRARPVKVADFSDHGARVAEGVSAGDLVVSAGTQFMKDDMKVKLPEQMHVVSTNAEEADSAAVR
jgi:multidrug efflux system membrane fusion protein